MEEDMSSSARCLTTCCIKLDHGQCKTDGDCCLDSTFCDVDDGGFCRAQYTHMAAALASAALLTKDDYPVSAEGDKTKLVLLILISIAVINTLCFVLHRLNNKMFFVSKAQVERITHDMEDSDDDDEDSDVAEEYLNEPSRMMDDVRSRQLFLQQPGQQPQQHRREYDIEYI